MKKDDVLSTDKQLHKKKKAKTNSFFSNLKAGKSG